MSAPGSRIVSLALASIGLGLCASCSESPTQSGPRGRPNVLLVTLDTTRADRLSCYGYEKKTTPNLDALAADAIRFDFAIAQSAVTPVSHASILTGRNPYSHGLRVIFAAEGYRLPRDVPTLATILGDAGWKTGAVLSSFTVSRFFGLDRGFAHWDDGVSAEGSGFQKRAEGAWDWNLAENQRRSDATTDLAIAWLRETNAPWCLWVHYWDPHDAVLTPPAEFLRTRMPTAASSPAEQLLALYDAEVEYMDAQFGRLMAHLTETGQLDNTIVVVVADHGEGLGDHDWWHHRILYQEQIHLPLIVRLPAGPRGVAQRELVRSIDVLPTILEAAGLAAPQGVEGRSLTEVLRADAAPRTAYADQLNLFDLNAAMLKRRPLDDLLHVAMDRRWKLIYRPRRPELSELYDLEADPRERENLYASRPEEAQRLLALLDASGGFRDEPFGEGDDPEAIRRLKSLGYAGDADDPAPPGTQPAEAP